MLFRLFLSFGYFFPSSFFVGLTGMYLSLFVIGTLGLQFTIAVIGRNRALARTAFIYRICTPYKKSTIDHLMLKVALECDSMTRNFVILRVCVSLTRNAVLHFRVLNFLFLVLPENFRIVPFVQLFIRICRVILEYKCHAMPIEQI